MSVDTPCPPERPRIQIEQEVEQNLGRVVGVQTQAIHGDVYGGDIYEVQVYALSGAPTEETWRRFLQTDTPPYKFLSSYTARDRALFKGRDAEVEELVRRVGAQQVLVVHGLPAVGKSSLLMAGAIPRLMEAGALAVRIQEYVQPAEALRAALDALSDRISVPLPAEGSLPELVRAVLTATKGSLILIFDQFERAATTGRGDLVQGIVQSLRAAPPELLRVVFVLRDDALGQLDDLQAAIPDLLRLPLKLAPLTREQALVAIEEPLAELRYPVSYVKGFVREVLVPDLDELSFGTPGIEPAHLQLVCHRLYEAACGQKPPHITEELYAELKGAEGIMASYLDETLRSRFADDPELAQQVLAALVPVGPDEWLPLSDLSFESVAPERLGGVLDRLVEAELLARRTLDGQVAYRLANESVAETITQLAGPEVRRQQAVERELDHAWFAWLARDALASRSQLRYVAASPPPALPPVRALLLLRAATSKNEPASPWLDALRTEQGRALVLGVEQPDSAPAGPSRSELRHAGQLLAPETPPPANSQFGPVTWTAASHPERATRETAALALAAAEPEAGVNRIGTALRALPSFPLRHWRRAELLGALADADAGTTPDQPATTRVLTWLWRVRRRLIGDRYEVGRLGAGAMLGAGVSLALLRIATGVVEGWRLAIMVSSVYLYFAALLGLGLAVGMATADALLLGRWKETSNRASPLLAIALGGGGFGLAHMLVALINGLRFEDDWLVAPLGFVAGVGLAVAVYPWYRTGRRGSPLMWLLRIALGSATLTLTQMAFNSVEGGGVSLAFITFRGYPESLLSLGRNNLRLLDSALTGAVLVLGSGLGLLLGARWIERWRRLTDLPGE